MKINLYNRELSCLPRTRPVANCSSKAGSTFANLCLALYLVSAFFERFLFRTSSSASVYFKYLSIYLIIYYLII